MKLIMIFLALLIAISVGGVVGHENYEEYHDNHEEHAKHHEKNEEHHDERHHEEHEGNHEGHKHGELCMVHNSHWDYCPPERPICKSNNKGFMSCVPEEEENEEFAQKPCSDDSDCPFGETCLYAGEGKFCGYEGEKDVLGRFKRILTNHAKHHEKNKEHQEEHHEKHEGHKEHHEEYHEEHHEENHEGHKHGELCMVHDSHWDYCPPGRPICKSNNGLMSCVPEEEENEEFAQKPCSDDSDCPFGETCLYAPEGKFCGYEGEKDVLGRFKRILTRIQDFIKDIRV